MLTPEQLFELTNDSYASEVAPWEPADAAGAISLLADQLHMGVGHAHYEEIFVVVEFADGDVATAHIRASEIPDLVL